MAEKGVTSRVQCVGPPLRYVGSLIWFRGPPILMSEIMSLLSNAGPFCVVSESSLAVLGPHSGSLLDQVSLLQDPSIQRRGPFSRTEAALLSI